MMTAFAVIALVVAAVVAGTVASRMLTHRGDDEQAGTQCGTCGGTAGKCMHDCMLEAATGPIEYYDDEELDAYRGRESDSYTDGEADEFREVLYTMRPDEVAGWTRSMTLRQINLPDQIKDEVIMLVGDSGRPQANTLQEYTDDGNT